MGNNRVKQATAVRVLGVVALAIAVTACGSSKTTAATTTAAPTTIASATTAAATTTAAPTTTAAGATTTAIPTASAAVTAKGFAFGPAVSHIDAGAPLAIVNGDSAAHTFTADDGKTFNVALPANKTQTLVLDTPGTYTFHCNIHPSMTGTLIVNPKG